MSNIKYIMDYRVNSADYAAHMNVTHWDTLKRLSIKNGKIVYNTGAISHPIEDRIAMFEERHSEPEYKQQLLQLEDQERRQREYLRSM